MNDTADTNEPNSAPREPPVTPAPPPAEPPQAQPATSNCPPAGDTISVAEFYKEVHTHSDRQFMRFLGMLTLTIMIFGLAVPYLQNRSLAKEREQIEKKTEALEKLVTNSEQSLRTQLQQSEKTIRELDQKLEKDKEEIQKQAQILFYYSLAVSSCGVGQYDEAIVSYTKAILTNPESPTLSLLHRLRGMAHRDNGEFKQAINDFTKTIELSPNDPLSYHGRGLVYALENEIDLAITDFSKAIELDANIACVYYNRGHAYFIKGNTDQAIVDYSKAIELDAYFAAVYSGRAEAYVKKGDQVLAKKDLQRAEELKAIKPRGVRPLPFTVDNQKAAKNDRGQSFDGNVPEGDANNSLKKQESK